MPATSPPTRHRRRPRFGEHDVGLDHGAILVLNLARCQRSLISPPLRGRVRRRRRLPAGGDPVTPIARRVESRVRSVLARHRATWAAEQPALSELFAALDGFVAAGGKRLRPAFCYWGALAGGATGDEPELLDTRGALELLHAFALIHDDVMDGSATRRTARPACVLRSPPCDGGWRRREPPPRRGLGDPGRRPRIRPRRYSGRRRSCQRPAPVARDAGRAGGGPVGRRGGGREFGAPPTWPAGWPATSRAGTPWSGRSTSVRRWPATTGSSARTPALGEPLGEAFQLRDDLLGVYGDPVDTGKPSGDDLREGKPTLLLALATGSGGAGRRMIERVGSRTSATTRSPACATCSSGVGRGQRSRPRSNGSSPSRSKRSPLPGSPRPRRLHALARRGPEGSMTRRAVVVGAGFGAWPRPAISSARAGTSRSSNG